jgi:hypothetical protein
VSRCGLSADALFDTLVSCVCVVDVLLGPKLLLWSGHTYRCGCLEYVIAAKSRNDDDAIVWQCFVYKILRDHHSKWMQLWMIVPW